MSHDVFNGADLQEEPQYVVTRDVLYADDTLLVSQPPRNIQTLPETNVTEGRKYGKELN